jgi:ornithine--oxo-acid transaminase
LTGGMMPMSCVLANNHIMDNIEPGSHGSTYGGNPLASAIAIEAVDIIKDEELLQNATKYGSLFRDTIHDNFIKTGLIKDVRGKGLLNAIEFNTPEMADIFVTRLMENGVLTKITRDKTVRMCPPLTLSSSEYQESMDIIIKTLKNI